MRQSASITICMVRASLCLHLRPNLVDHLGQVQGIVLRESGLGPDPLDHRPTSSIGGSMEAAAARPSEQEWPLTWTNGGAGRT